MYRPQIILARNISIEVPRRRSSPEIAAVNRDPSRATAIGLNSIDWFPPVIAWNYSAEPVVRALARGH